MTWTACALELPYTILPWRGSTGGMTTQKWRKRKEVSKLGISTKEEESWEVCHDHTVARGRWIWIFLKKSHGLNGSPNLDIEDQVFALVEQNLPPKPITPSRVSSSVNYSTPIKSNTGSQQGDGQKHGDIDDLMLEEIRDCTDKDTKRFYKKYFEGRPWSTKAEKIVKDAKDANRKPVTNGRVIQICHLTKTVFWNGLRASEKVLSEVSGQLLPVNG